MNAETAIRPSLIGSLAKALADIEGVQKNKDNPGLRGARYADLSAVIDAIEPIKAHGLWYRQVPKRDPDGACIETFYIHESGDELSAGDTFVPANKRDAQGFGSALTYCRRYALMTAFGLAAEDDDGHAATQGMRGGGDQSRCDERQNQGRQRQRQQPKGDEKVEGGMPDAEWAKLAQLLKATNTPAERLLKHFDVKNLRLLNQDQFTEAVGRLNDTLATMAKQETDRKAGAASDDIDDDSIPY